MFNKKPNGNSLDSPPVAETNTQAAEVIRVWAAPGSPVQITLRTTWNDAGAWGLMLADVARHASKAYAKEGHDPVVILARIRAMFEAEMETPTDEPKDITER